MKRRFFAACAAFVLIGCCLLGLRLLSAPEKADVPAPDLALPGKTGPTLALFTSSADPWYAELSDRLEQWAREQGWGVIVYDCMGDPRAQKEQARDLVKTEGADVALLCTLAADEGGEGDLSQVRTLYEARLPVVTLSPRTGLAASRKVTCHIGPEPDGVWAAAAGFFGRRDVFLLSDLPEDGWVEGAEDYLEAHGVGVSGSAACWGVADYAREYVDWALGFWPETSGAAAGSLPCALGAKGAFRAVEGAKVLCLEGSPQALEALELGRVDAVAAVTVQDALSALQTVLPQAVAGKAPDFQHLKVRLLTP